MVWVNVKSKGLLNIPGFPEISNDLWFRTAKRLKARKNEFQPAVDGLTRRYTFTGEKRALQARNWLFAEGDEPPAQNIRMGAVSLEDPKQFMISWTRYKNELQPGADEILGGQLAQELTHAEVATHAFWPRIAKYGTGYNLIGILRKVTAPRLVELKTLLGGHPVGSRKPLPEPSFWQERFETLQKGGRLFEIDLSVLEDLQPRKYNDGNVKLVRYNPATLTLLEMTPEKALLPILVRSLDSKRLSPSSDLREKHLQGRGMAIRSSSRQDFGYTVRNLVGPRLPLASRSCRDGQDNEGSHGEENRPPGSKAPISTF